MLALCAATSVSAPSATAADNKDTYPLGVAELQNRYRTGKISASDTVTALLRNIRVKDADYNAFTYLNPKALEEARAIDRRRAAGKPLGPLAGIPLAVKESIDVRGWPSTAAWSALNKKTGGVELIASQDAPAVARLREAGAILLGKTNMPAFSSDATRTTSSWAGMTHNAFHRKLAPGASSAGAATAVAAGFAAAALAEETGGSIQNPAAAQGLVGVKPTLGLVPNTGVVPLGGSTRDVLGPIARTVQDAALLLDVIAGFTEEDPKTRLGVDHRPISGYAAALQHSPRHSAQHPTLTGTRLGLYGPGWRLQPLAPATEAAYRRAQTELERLGASLIEDPFAHSGFTDLIPSSMSADLDGRGLEAAPYDLDRYYAALDPRSAVHGLDDLRKVTGRDPFGEGEPLALFLQLPSMKENLEHPSRLPDLTKFQALRADYLRIFDKVMDEHRLDALVFPQMYKEVPSLAGDEMYGATTASQINIAGLPAVTVPAGRHASGSPFALIFVGRLWSEAKLLTLAYGYEQSRQEMQSHETR